MTHSKSYDPPNPNQFKTQPFYPPKAWYPANIKKIKYVTRATHPSRDYQSRTSRHSPRIQHSRIQTSPSDVNKTPSPNKQKKSSPKLIQIQKVTTPGLGHPSSSATCRRARERLQLPKTRVYHPAA
ncbi:glycerol dehydrogenase related enzyme [Lasius niger]|uniref:Glycerol dehydrogenase related enzyme n=1 Tax=Lasius niger TaxID=67767 RepID=A0A0J7JUC5_LASNI|nr:glycerol dehydrogenase related enzyme [Lasius niger]